VECVFKLFQNNPLIDGSSNVMEIIFFQLVKGVKTFSKMFHNHTLCAKAYLGSCEMDENPAKQGPHSLTLRLGKGGGEVYCATSSISSENLHLNVYFNEGI
jgi:hypothetical protein